MGYDACVNIKKKYSRNAVERLLVMLGYKKKGDSFYCESDGEYKLYCGIHVWLDDENEEEWVYRVRSQIYANGYDLRKMNETIRCLKRYCDATFESDEGKNRYFKEGVLIECAQNGCYLAAERLMNNFSLLKHALSKYPDDIEAEKLVYEIGGIPTPNMFNANVYSTYLCSLIEEYFKSTYIVLLKYSERKEKILNVKFSSYDMTEISNGKKTVEEAFANTLSFQNIQKICANFHALDNKLDIGQALKKPYHNRKKNLYEQIDDILERRHGLIHRLKIDDRYYSDSLERDIQDVTVAIKRVYTYICKSYSWKEQELSL